MQNVDKSQMNAAVINVCKLLLIKAFTRRAISNMSACWKYKKTYNEMIIINLLITIKPTIIRNN